MGIERIVYHSVGCDKCKKVLDDYEDNLSRIKPNRIMVTKIAENHGFVRTKFNTWLCPDCAKLY